MSETAVESMLRHARELPFGSARLKLVEQAVKKAEESQVLELQFAARLEFVFAAVFAEHLERAIVASTWCLSLCDQHPGRFDEIAAVWCHATVVQCAPSFPSISRQKIMTMVDDIEKRMRRLGVGRRRAVFIRWQVTNEMGDLDSAIEAFDRWRTMPAGDWDVCNACQTDCEVDFLLTIGEYEEALRSAQPILTGRLTCAEVPHRTYSRLLLPLLEMGRHEQAASVNRKGYRLVRSNIGTLDWVGPYMIYRAATNGPAAAFPVLERHLPLAAEVLEPATRFRFFLAAWVLMEIAARKRREVIKLHVPKTFAVPSHNGQYPVVELVQHFRHQATSIAERFRLRNRSHHHDRLIADALRWVEWRA